MSKKTKICDKIAELEISIFCERNHIISRLKRVENSTNFDELQRELSALNDYVSNCLKNLNTIEILTYIE